MGCNDDDHETIEVKQICGNWNRVSFYERATFEGGMSDTTTSEDANSFRITLVTDGTGQSFQNVDDEWQLVAEFTWQLNGDMLIMRNTLSDMAVSYKIVELTKTTMTLELEIAIEIDGAHVDIYQKIEYQRM